MGYQIRYDDAMTRIVFDHKRKRSKRNILFFLLAVIFTITTITLATKGYLIPGDTAVTKAAAKNFRQEMRDGEDIGKAFAAFCKEIVDGAQLS